MVAAAAMRQMALSCVLGPAVVSFHCARERVREESQRMRSSRS